MHAGRNVLSSLLALRGVTRLQSAAIGEARAGVVVPRDTLACHRIKSYARVLVACIRSAFGQAASVIAAVLSSWTAGHPNEGPFQGVIVSFL